MKNLFIIFLFIISLCFACFAQATVPVIVADNTARDALTVSQPYVCVRASNTCYIYNGGSWQATGGGGSGTATAIQTATSLPGTCTAGAIIQLTNTTPNRLFSCSATDTWSEIWKANTSGSSAYQGVRINGANNNTELFTTSGTNGVTLTNGSGTQTLSVDNTYLGSATQTLTNKTYDASATGNVFTSTFKTFIAAGGCVNTTAGSFWDLPTSAAAVATCVTGTNIQKGILAYPDTTGGFSAQVTNLLPSDFTGSINVRVIWYSGATTGNVRWDVSTVCTATNGSATDDPAFNTASSITTTVPGSANQITSSSITGLTITGCSAGNLLHLKVFRNGDNDTSNATANLMGVEAEITRAQ
jgi:hypothetical protein